MNLFAIAGLLCGGFCAILALIAFIYGKAKIHRILAFFNVAVALWGIGSFLVGISNSEAEAMFAWKITYVGGVFISALFFHMVCTFCKIQRKSQQYNE